MLVMQYKEGDGLQFTPSFYEIGGPVGADWDTGLDVILGPGNNINLAGNTQSFGLGTSNPMLFKLKTNDTIEWQKSLSQSGSWVGNFVGVDRDSSGNIYVSGRGDNATDRDHLVAKYNSSGALQWQRVIGGTTNYDYEGKSVRVDSSGNVWVLGSEHNTSSNERRANVVKFDSSGTVLVQESYRSPSPTSQPFNPYEIVLDSSGDPYIMGYSAYADFPRAGGVILKLNQTTGAITWQKDILEGSIGMNTYDGVVADSGNIYLVGHLNNDALLIKLDNTGAVTWARTIYGAGSHQHEQVALDSSENVYTTGWQYDGSSYKVIVAKYDSAGTLQWQRIAENSGWNMQPYGMDANDNVIVVAGLLSQERDVLIMRVATDGTGTGSYVGEHTWTYSASSLTTGSPSMSSSNGAYATVANSYSVSTSTFTATDGNLNIDAIDY